MRSSLICSHVQPREDRLIAWVELSLTARPFTTDTAGHDILREWLAGVVHAFDGYHEACIMVRLSAMFHTGPSRPLHAVLQSMALGNVIGVRRALLSGPDHPLCCESPEETREGMLWRTSGANPQRCADDIFHALDGS